MFTRRSRPPEELPKVWLPRQCCPCLLARLLTSRRLISTFFGSVQGRFGRELSEFRSDPFALHALQTLCHRWKACPEHIHELRLGLRQKVAELRVFFLAQTELVHKF